MQRATNRIKAPPTAADGRVVMEHSHIRSSRLTAITAACVLALMMSLPAAATAAPAAPAKTSSATHTAKTAKTSKDVPKIDDSYEQQPLSKGFEEAVASTDSKGHKVEAAGKKKSGGAGAIGRMFFGLVIVLGVIFGVYWLLKRYGESRMNGITGSSGIIDVVATTTLAPNRSLHLVRVGGEIVLVGATEHSITQLSTIESADFAAGAGHGGGGDFHGMLTSSLGSSNAPTSMQGTTSGGGRRPFIARVLGNLQMMTAR